MVTSLAFRGLSGLLFFLLSLSLPAQSVIDPIDQAAMTDFYNALTNTGSTLPGTNPADWCDASLTEVVCNAGKVTSIEIGGLGLAGTLTPSLGNLTALLELSLDINHFSGTIPTELGFLTNLVVLSLYSNSFEGTIPTELGNLSQLQILYLDGNELTGTIPTVLGSFVNLTEIYVSSNQLTGTIPSELGNLSLVEEFYADSNQLTGTIPSELGNLFLVIDFYVSSNQLTGTIPSELGNLSLVEEFYVSSNQLTGTIPSELGNLSLVEEFYLSDNQLTGTIPATLSNMTNLGDLYLLGTNNLCPLVDYSSWSNSNDFPGSTNCTACAEFTCQNNGTCSGGFDELFSCSCTSSWFGSNCEIVGCPVETSEGASFPSIAPGSSANGTCTQGYYGSPSRPCQDDGSWGAVVNPCTACGCSESGSLDQICNSAGQCTCKEGFAGIQCSQCADGYSGTNCTLDPGSPGSKLFISWMPMMALCLCLSIFFL